MMANILTIICVLIVMMSVVVIFYPTTSFFFILIVLLIFAAYIAVSTAVLNKMVFNPLKMLTRSISSHDEGTGIYGSTRDDEIGELARETHKTWARINESNDELIKAATEQERQAGIINAVNDMATTLLNAVNAEALNAAIPEGMKLIAECTNLDRIYIWQNEIVNGVFCFTLKYEWLGSYGDIGNPVHIGHSLSYFEHAPEWFELFLRDEHICKPVKDLGPKERAILQYSGVKAVLAIPVYLHGTFWGFVSFDNCRTEDTLTREEINILRSGSFIFTSAIYRNLMTGKLQEAVEQANSANRSKSDFLAGMSNEIRTPMNSIMGFAEMALGDANPPGTKDCLNKILENSNWLLQLIDDIMDISNIESGKVGVENISFDLGDLMTACRTAILPSATEKGLSVHFYVEPPRDSLLHGDPVKLSQILMNLLTNAVKFTETGTISALVSVRRSTPEVTVISFDVKDTGIGMTEEQLKTIFDPFTQAETGTAHKYGGGGLGLPIARYFIEMMGGRLFAESTVGKGSKFNFELTFSTTSKMDEIIREEKPVSNDTMKPVFSGEVLVCEDNLMSQQVICDHLSRVGLEVTVADNGKDGFDLVDVRRMKNEKQFDLILMDIYMPIMDGLEAAAEIIRLDTGVPIVAMTANVMADDKDVYLSRGMKDVVGKPFSRQELWRCLKKYLEPVSYQQETDPMDEKAESELRQLLINTFVTNNREKFNEINNAIDENDIVLAHRLAHTLKNNAGQLGEFLLHSAAESVEHCLIKIGSTKIDEQMEALHKELNETLQRLEPMTHFPSVPDHAAGPVDLKAAYKVLENLEFLLKDSDFDCLSYVDKLKAIPGSEDLIKDIIDLEFKPALEKLSGLRETLDDSRDKDV